MQSLPSATSYREQALADLVKAYALLDGTIEPSDVITLHATIGAAMGSIKNAIVSLNIAENIQSVNAR